MNLTSIPGSKAVGLVCLLAMSVASDVNAAWVTATGNLSGMATECGEVQGLFSVPDANLTIAVVSTQGIWSTTNGGLSWAKMGGATGSTITFRGMQMVVDPVNQGCWWVCGIYHTPGIVKTTDNGATWTGCDNNSNTTHDGMAVDFSDPQRKTLLAGTHEASQILWKSTDGGSTWTNIGSKLPAGGYSQFPYILDSQTYLMGIGSVGICRSTDGGNSWSTVSTQSPVSHITKAASGELYFTASGGKVVKGASDGTTWTALNNVTSYAAPLIEVPGGKIAVMNPNGVSISADKGATWKTGCSPMPAAITSAASSNFQCNLAYNSGAGAFYTHWISCSNNVKPDAIWRFDTMIATGTGVVAPKQAPHASINNALNATTLFDIAGRKIRSAVQVKCITAGSERVYIMRGNNGIVTKQVSLLK